MVYVYLNLLVCLWKLMRDCLLLFLKWGEGNILIIIRKINFSRIQKHLTKFKKKELLKRVGPESERFK